MKTNLTLHVKPIVDAPTGTMRCGYVIELPGDAWVTMNTFIMLQPQYRGHANFTYIYCQACYDAITPMEYLNAVEL